MKKNRMRMRLVLACGLFFLVVGPTSAQTRFFWGPEIYPNYSGRRLIIFGTTVSDKTIEELNANERGKFSFAGGLQAGWKGPKAGFRFGLLFSETGYRTIKSAIAPDDPDSPEGATAKKSVYRNYNLEMPVSVDFIHDLDDKNTFFFSLGAGMSVNLTNQQRTIYYYGDRTESTEGPESESEFRILNYGFITGMGWERDLSSRLSMYFQPNFQFWFKSLMVDAEIDRSLYALGLKAGLRFYSGEP